MTKARRPMSCECCRAHISTGSQFVTFHGRPWKPACVIAYKKRRGITGGASSGRD